MPRAPCTAVFHAPDGGGLVAAFARAQPVRVFDAESGDELRVFDLGQLSPSPVAALAMATCGCLAIALQDRRVDLTDAP